MGVIMVMKALLASTCVVLLAVMLKQSLPLILDMLTHELPYYWSSFMVSWMRPSYLYILINCIILSIVASSKLQPRLTTTTTTPANSTTTPSPSEKERELEFDFLAAGEVVIKQEEEEEVVKEVVFGYVERNDKLEDDVVAVVESGGDVVVEEELKAWPVPEKVEMLGEGAVEKPSYSARCGYRKGVKASPDGKTMLKKVSRPKRQETLESTWRTLTEGRAMPLKRHLRKSDTFIGETSPASPPMHVIKKSDTFSYRSNAESPSPGSSGGKLRRESSLSQDDLNRRVEAFIKKFNEEMRLQRQESLRQHQEMVR